MKHRELEEDNGKCRLCGEKIKGGCRACYFGTKCKSICNECLAQFHIEGTQNIVLRDRQQPSIEGHDDWKGE